MFLGRRLNTNTQCYDEIPVEAAQEIQNLATERLGEQGQGILVLEAIAKMKERYERHRD